MKEAFLLLLGMNLGVLTTWFLWVRRIQEDKRQFVKEQIKRLNDLKEVWDARYVHTRKQLGLPIEPQN